MGVIRVEHTRDYTVMSNEHLRDRRLSLRAMGLMSRMLSDSDNYQHSIAGLAAVCKEGRDAVRKALQELEEAGYLVREQTRRGGSFSSCDYTLYEHSRTPETGEGRILPSRAGPTAACALPHNDKDTVKADGDPPLTEKPSTVNPTTGNPTTENPTQRNTKGGEVPKEETPCSPPTGDACGGADPKRRRRREPKEAPDWKPERFAKFWHLYPRGEAKQAAIKAWDALKADDELLIVMGRALLSQMASREWTEGIGIPYASTWLNQRRWTDVGKAPPTEYEGRRDIGWI